MSDNRWGQRAVVTRVRKWQPLAERGVRHGSFPSWVPASDRPVHVACRHLRRGPHNKCSHATLPPLGYTFCKGDPGCPIRIPTGTVLCSWHKGLVDYDRLVGDNNFMALMLGPSGRRDVR